MPENQPKSNTDALDKKATDFLVSCFNGTHGLLPGSVWPNDSSKYLGDVGELSYKGIDYIKFINAIQSDVRNFGIRDSHVGNFGLPDFYHFGLPDVYHYSQDFSNSKDFAMITGRIISVHGSEWDPNNNSHSKHL